MSEPRVHYYHKKEGPRHISIAYMITFNEYGVPDTVCYGATIHKPDTKSDCWVRKLHATKANERLALAPVILPYDRVWDKKELPGAAFDKPGERFRAWRKFEKRLRRMLGIYRCEGEQNERE